jgi:hypothetical protein
MKTQFISKICGSLLPIIFVANSSFAQEPDIKMLPPVTVTSKTTTANVSQKVMKAFQSAFKEGENPKWYQLNKNFLVNFIMYQQQHSALFKKNGYMVYHIAYGEEKNLPADIRKIIKPNYYDYNITKVVKVNVEDRNIWVINLEDTKNFIIVRVENGEMEEVQKLSKG